MWITLMFILATFCTSPLTRIFWITSQITIVVLSAKNANQTLGTRWHWTCLSFVKHNCPCHRWCPRYAKANKIDSWLEFGDIPKIWKQPIKSPISKIPLPKELKDLHPTRKLFQTTRKLIEGLNVILWWIMTINLVFYLCISGGFLALTTEVQLWPTKVHYIHYIYSFAGFVQRFQCDRPRHIRSKIKNGLAF